MRAPGFAALLLSAGLAAACGGDAHNPVGPGETQPPTIASLSVRGADYVLTRSAAPYTAAAMLSDGSTKTVAAAWSSSAANVASIDSTGRLDARAHGATTVTATYEGRAASIVVHAVNNYQGTWLGQYVIKACANTGIFEDGVHGPPFVDVPWCNVNDRVGTLHSFGFALTQSGSHYEQIRATFGFDYTDAIPGVVSPDGTLLLAGTLHVLDWYGDPWGDKEIGGWETSLDASDAMVGHWAERLTMVGESGEVDEQLEIVDVRRTTTALTARGIATEAARLR